VYDKLNKVSLVSIYIDWSSSNRFAFNTVSNAFNVNALQLLLIKILPFKMKESICHAHSMQIVQDNSGTT
jgi:hypothetical protein